MAMPAERLGTSRSELSVNSKLSDSRRAKLLNMKQREDLKDQLTEKFKGRFGHGGAKEADEVSVCSAAIRRDVEDFASKARASESNLDRLERKLRGRAQGKGEDDSMVSGVSAYTGLTGLSRLSAGSRSATSLVGKNLVEGRKHDWSKLDEYASYLHEQDALRQSLGVKALQRKLKMDLDQQVKEKKRKDQEALAEEERFHQNTLAELERWKHQEQERDEEKKEKIRKEQKDRDDQLLYERQLRDAEERRKKTEEAALVEKICTEMEGDQKRHEKKKEQVKKAMRKVQTDNVEDQRKRKIAELEAKDKEAETMKEYNRILDQQEEQRAEELVQRMEKQKVLMKKLQESSGRAKAEAGDNDSKRADAQQEEQDRHFFEAEAVKQHRLKQMRLENQAYLLKQMDERNSRGEEENYLTSIQAQILERDTIEYTQKEKQKFADRRTKNVAHRKELEKQMKRNAQVCAMDMDDKEVAINKPLLDLVDRTLATRNENMRLFSSVPEE